MNNVRGKSEKGRCFCQTTFLRHCRNKIFCTYLEPLVPNSCWKIPEMSCFPTLCLLTVFYLRRLYIFIVITCFTKKPAAPETFFWKTIFVKQYIFGYVYTLRFVEPITFFNTMDWWGPSSAPPLKKKKWPIASKSGP